MEAVATAGVPAAAKTWMRDGMEHDFPPLTVARLYGHFPGMLFRV